MTVKGIWWDGQNFNLKLCPFIDFHMGRYGDKRTAHTYTGDGYYFELVQVERKFK